MITSLRLNSDLMRSAMNSLANAAPIVVPKMMAIVGRKPTNLTEMANISISSRRNDATNQNPLFSIWSFYRWGEGPVAIGGWTRKRSK